MSTITRKHGHRWRALCVQAKMAYPTQCHICMQPIDITLDSKHRDSWTLDHLDPVSVHGDHVPTLDRVRPAHRGCNARRGAGPAPGSPRSEQW